MFGFFEINCSSFFVCVELSWVGPHGPLKLGVRRVGARRGGCEGWWPEGGWPNPEKRGGPKGGGPKGGGTKGGGPKGGGTKGVVGPKFRVFFSFSRPHNRSFCLSMGVFSWNFGGVFKGWPSNVHVWSSRAVV